MKNIFIKMEISMDRVCRALNKMFWKTELKKLQKAEEYSTYRETGRKQRS